MANLKRVKAIYGKDGSSKVEPIEGITGSSCTAVTEPFQKAMGGQVLEHELKDDYYKQETEKVTVGS